MREGRRRGGRGGEERRERGTPRAPRGRGSFIPGSRLPTSSRVSPSRGPATCHLPLASNDPPRPRPCPLISLSFSDVAETPYFTYLVPLLLLLLQAPSILIPFSFVAPSRGSLPGSPLVNPRRELECACFFSAGIESDSSVTLIPGIVDFSS